MTVTALSGAGWTCIVATETCLRADALAPAASYPDIIITATVGPGGARRLSNRVVVSGGDDANPTNNVASSAVTIVEATSVPVLPLSFVLGLMSVLLAIALSALRTRRVRLGDGRSTRHHEGE